MKIHPFIFNWNRVTSKTKVLENQLSKYNNLTIINSDPQYTKQDWINLGDNAYFGTQFAQALRLFNGDILFHIQGDAEYCYWDEIIKKALYCFEFDNCGIYAPNVNFTYWDTPRVLESNYREKLYNVKSTDCTAWFIHKDIILKLLELEKNKNIISANYLGWGIPFLASAISKHLGKNILRDHNFTIYHEKGTYYDSKIAHKLKNKMFQKLEPELQETIKYLYKKNLTSN